MVEIRTSNTCRLIAHLTEHNKTEDETKLPTECRKEATEQKEHNKTESESAGDLNGSA